MKRLPKQTIYFFFIFSILVLLPLLFLSKGDIVYATNQTYSQESVLFFRAINMLGDGILFAYIGVFYLLFSFRRTIFLALMIIIQTVIVRFFKDGIADGFPRPHLFFENLNVNLQAAEMVNIHLRDSFPSGHATTAFTIALFLILQLKNTKLQLLLFIPFCIAAFARVYLAQHFYIDIVAGLLIGFFTMMSAQSIYYGFRLDQVKGSVVKLLYRKRKPAPILLALE